MEILKFSILESTNDQSKESRKKTFLPFLPYPILAEILSRVPAKTLFTCMTVSKPWFSLTDNSLFKRQHFSRSKICPLLIFDTIYSPKKLNPLIFHLVEGETVSDLGNKLNSRIEMCKNGANVKSQDTEMNGFLLTLNSKATSCEGLVCTAPRHGGISENGGRDHVIICNPITKEYLTVNLFKGVNECRSVFIGLGFSRVDNEFRLLRVSKSLDGSEWFPEICGVGSKNWQHVRVPLIVEVDFRREVSDIVYVSGVMYWSYSGDVSICSFDFDANEFRVVQLPVMMDGKTLEANSFVTKNVCLGVLESSLCVSLVCPDDGHVELWMIEKDGGRTKWRMISDIESETSVMEHGGSFYGRGDYKSIKYLDCGKILLHDWWGTFLVYDPVTRSDELLCVLDDSYLNRLGTRFNFQVVPHIPSLVSLRDRINIEDADCVVLKDH